MYYVRKLVKPNQQSGKRYLGISIPLPYADIFPTDTVIIENLPDNRGILILPAEVRPLHISA